MVSNCIDGNVRDISCIFLNFTICNSFSYYKLNSKIVRKKFNARDAVQNIGRKKRSSKNTRCYIQCEGFLRKISKERESASCGDPIKETSGCITLTRHLELLAEIFTQILYEGFLCKYTQPREMSPEHFKFSKVPIVIPLRRQVKN